jgi:hypothetical protein
MWPLVALLLLSVLPAAAQTDPGEVSGRVIDARGNEPLARVQVQLAGTPHRTVTEADGTFRLTAIPPGGYILHVSTVGYHLIRQSFTLAPGEAKTFDVLLTASNASRTESVDVKAEPFDLARQESSSALTLSGNEEKNLASVLADDPLRAVQSLPGVSANNDFSSEFNLRGASFERIGLYLDGVLLHSPFHMVTGQSEHGSLTLFNGDMLDTLTLYEGAWPTRYSDRTGGILAVETREGNRQQTQLHAAASASNLQVLAEGPLDPKKRASWMVAFRKSYLQYILNRIDFGSTEPSVAFGFTDGQARLSFDLTPKHNLSLSYLDGYSDLDRTVARTRLGLNSAMTSGFRFSLLSLASRYAPHPRFLLSSRFAWSRERGHVENRDYSSLAADGYGEWTGRSDATWIWGGRHPLDFGGLVRRLRDDGYLYRYEFVPVQVRPLDRFRGTARRQGAYVQQTFVLASGKVRLVAGARRDGHTTSLVDVTSPYASLALQPFAATRVQFDWGQYAQFPELSQFYSIFGRPSLLPLRASHFNAALEQRLDERTRVRLEFYNRQDRDLLARPQFDPRVLPNGRIFNPPAGAPILNSQRGYARGVQAFLQRRTANGLTGWISYTYGQSKTWDGDLRLWFPSDFDQRHTLNISGSYRLRPTVNLSGRWTYGSGFPIPGFYRQVQATYFLAPDRNGLRIKAYQRADARINKAFVYARRKLTLFAEVVNLTNRTNRNYDSPGSYDSRTGRANLNFLNLFPVLPSAGILVEF